MGGCCTCQRVRIERYDGYRAENANYRVQREVEDEYEYDDDHGIVGRATFGANVRLHGSSKYVSMFSQQGKKGINQDAMTVWENFGGQKDWYFCGVFDGHGPSGHKVARYVRDVLPSKVSLSLKGNNSWDSSADNNLQGGDVQNHPVFIKTKSNIIKAFKDMDNELEGDSSVETYSSGTTSITVSKLGEHLIIGNLGDSRAVLCTTDDEGALVPEQLSVDLKPNLPSERERITSCQGRVMAMKEEPSVFRVWMPNEDCPGLAMARAFGDFCLKDYGLISTPEVYYRKLSDKDEFVVLATDGVWDVLSNEEVIRVVASAKKRSAAAQLVVERAVRAWKTRYPSSKIDDCAVVCLFFKRQSSALTKSASQIIDDDTCPTNAKTDDGLDTVLDYKVKDDDASELLISPAT
ncbi:probable protein phosphatase 2C 65 [Ipomoea triloba]|uniref:probable protein phosphatase 2C 65 n=1 Tax=Ipomoea triloba TaxID=35885 RepID=UPI00125E90E9|nr:probable protein phosphatase 2C 65 [Ipomoea triloba]